MALRIFDALLPYFGNKRKLCPVIFGHIAKYLPRDKWQKSVFVDAFLGSGAVGLYAKAQGFRVICNDIAERSYIAGRALIDNNYLRIRSEDIQQLFQESNDNKHTIENAYVPDVFTRRHAVFLDNAFANAASYLQKYLLLKYIFSIRPYSKFSSPNAFNRPFEEGRFDEIKKTYIRHIQDNLTPPWMILHSQARKVNKGIFSNGRVNQAYKEDIFNFIDSFDGDVLYLDPPYAGTLSYESEYDVLDKILGDERSKSPFSAKDGIDVLDNLLSKAEKFPLWVISFGNAGGKNDLNKLIAGVNQRF